MGSTNSTSKSLQNIYDRQFERHVILMNRLEEERNAMKNARIRYLCDLEWLMLGVTTAAVLFYAQKTKNKAPLVIIVPLASAISYHMEQTTDAYHSSINAATVQALKDPTRSTLTPLTLSDIEQRRKALFSK